MSHQFRSTLPRIGEDRYLPICGPSVKLEERAVKLETVLAPWKVWKVHRLNATKNFVRRSRKTCLLVERPNEFHLQFRKTGPVQHFKGLCLQAQIETLQWVEQVRRPHSVQGVSKPTRLPKLGFELGFPQIVHTLSTRCETLRPIEMTHRSSNLSPPGTAASSSIALRDVTSWAPTPSIETIVASTNTDANWRMCL